MKLRDWLKKEGLTNVEFAQRIGVTPVTVCRWAYDRHVPEIYNLQRIFEATGGEVSPNSFITE